MSLIKDIKKISPIKIDDYTIQLLDYTDVEWFKDFVATSYYTEFMDVRIIELGDIKLTKYLNTLINKYNNEDKGKYSYRFTIKHKGSNIGVISFMSSETSGNYDLGYGIISEFKNKGIATKIIGNLSDTLLNLKEIKCIHLEIMENNIASIRVAEKSGYEFIRKKKGKYRNNLIYEKTKN